MYQPTGDRFRIDRLPTSGEGFAAVRLLIGGMLDHVVPDVHAEFYARSDAQRYIRYILQAFADEVETSLRAALRGWGKVDYSRMKTDFVASGPKPGATPAPPLGLVLCQVSVLSVHGQTADCSRVVSRWICVGLGS